MPISSVTVNSQYVAKVSTYTVFGISLEYLHIDYDGLIVDDWSIW